MSHGTLDFKNSMRNEAFFFFFFLFYFLVSRYFKILHLVGKTVASLPTRPNLDLLRCTVHPDHLLQVHSIELCYARVLPSKNFLKIAANVADELV